MKADGRQWDKMRTLRQGLIGGLVLSPGIHLFHTRFMSKLTFSRMSFMGGILARVGITQAFMMPLIQFSMLFLSAALQPADSVEQRVQNGKDRFESKWVTGCTASLMFWPLVNTFMYTRIQPFYFSLFKDCMALIFSSLMSYITYN
jgi:hypothetical protein